MKKICFTDRCTGCGACYNSCNRGAITMQLNEDGFYVPVVDVEKCVDCNICQDVCPVNHSQYVNDKNPVCYAFMADDEVRSRSSSGGAFEVFAIEVLDNKGSVFGVAHKEDFTTQHIEITNKDDLRKLQGSKYVMSDVGLVYRKVRANLKKGDWVLFSGTPCQVAGLNAFLGNMKNDSHLITVDLICHGVPSVKAFKKYIADLHGNRDIKYIGYKEKQYGWHASMTIDFADGDRYNAPCEEDTYFWSYLAGVNKNKCCGDCPFAKIPRQGDITIGDFWRISEYKKELNDGKGTSVILINNEKGKQFLDRILDKAKVCEEAPLEAAIKGNSNLVSSPKVHVSRNRFFKDLSSRRFGELAQWSYVAERYDVGIVGIPTYVNFGGALTYYSLYSFLVDNGYSVCSISRPRSCGRPPIMAETVYEKNPYPAGSLKLEFRDKEAMREMNNVCETFLVGSDQLFNADLYYKFGEMITLDWVSDNHRKVAYAASFGHSVFWGREELRAKMAHDMQKFDAFSVREKDGVTLAKNTFGVDAEWVIDPIFLCDKKHYEELAENATRKNPNPHIFGYILDSNDITNDILDYCSEQCGLEVELFSEMLFKPTADKLESEGKRFRFPLRQAKIEERLYSLIHSEYIVADSFHGVCFAIIFNIPFVAILNANRGATRFYTILEKVGLTERLVTNLDEAKDVLDKPIDFTYANAALEKEKARCSEWLLNAISPLISVKKAYSADDVINQRFDAQKKINRRYEMKINALLNGKLFCKVSDIEEYLNLLNENKEGLNIIISVKDTPGFEITDSIVEKLKNLGCKISLKDKHWHSYVCVISNGKVIAETISKNEERVAYNGSINGRTYKVVSRSFRKGNISAIQIDGIEYSENHRGLNIVVIDTCLNEVVDSVVFDTHEKNAPCYREGKHCVSQPSHIEKTSQTVQKKVETKETHVNEKVWAEPGIHKNSEILLHNAMLLATVGGSAFDYLIDKGIKRVTIYGDDLLVSYLYEQAYYKDFEIVDIIGPRKKQLDIRFPRVGKIDINPISDIDLNTYSVPVIIADTAYPKELLNYKNNGNIALGMGELCLYSHYKRLLFDPILSYAKNYPSLKLSVFSSPSVYKIKNPSELEQDIRKNHPNHNRLQVSQEVFEKNGFDAEYIKEVTAPINVKKGRIDKLVDKTGKYVNVVNGYRLTTDTPTDYSNTVYMFGNSICYGFGAGDSETIASVMQREINEHWQELGKYSVLNCANGGGLNAKQMMQSINYHMPQNGDVIVIAMSDMTELLQEIYEDRFIWCNGKDVLDRPHSYGEIYFDINHVNAKGQEICGKYLAEILFQNGALVDKETLEQINKNRGIPVFETTFDDIENAELDEYIRSIERLRKKNIDGKVGAIVMNCNPFTLGHRYLIESAAKQCALLYIFVVEENRSVFSFDDRISLVKKGVSDLKNVIVIPSGKFIISQTTFSAYFLKEEQKDEVIDPSEDVSIFAAKIAPALGISVRFAGDEPFDKITNQYNATMKRILPKYGIEFQVIKRKEEMGEPISASRVRHLLKEKNFEEIKRIVPVTTFDYLYERYKDSKNVLVLGGTRFTGIRLVEKLIEKNYFVTIATRGIHMDSFGKQVDRVIIDRLDEQTVIDKLDGRHFDAIVDMSAYSGIAVKNILSHVSTDYYLQVSTVAVYGKHHLELTEQELNPMSVEIKWTEEDNYGINKRYAEATALQVFPYVKTAIVRIPFVVEPDNLDNKELNMRLFNYVKNIEEQVPMNVDNPDYMCTFVRTWEEAEFIEYLLNNEMTGVYNFSSVGSITVKEIISHIEEKIGKKAVISADGKLHPFNSKHFGYSGYSYNLSKAEQTGFHMYMLKDWIYDLLDQYIGMFEKKK